MRETGDRPGALPLMAYALERLYERDQGRPVLTHRSYLECGGMLGAIATQADRIFEDFAEAHGMAPAEAARRFMFSELVQVEGADVPVTRCRAALPRLGLATDPVADLAGRLVKARLLVTDHEAAAGPPPGRWSTSPTRP